MRAEQMEREHLRLAPDAMCETPIHTDGPHVWDEDDVEANREVDHSIRKGITPSEATEYYSNWVDDSLKYEKLIMEREHLRLASDAMCESPIHTDGPHVWDEDDVEANREVDNSFRKGITPSEATEYYSNWVDDSLKYEKDLCPGRYNGPVIAGKVVADYFEDDREKKKIMDIAAGTGFVAEQLKTHGFVHIDALEPSSKMLLRAKEKGLYEDIYTEYLCEVPLPIPNDTYDCAVISGGMGEGHIPCSGIPELIRIVKPGGIICIVMREVFLRDVDEYKDRLEPLMDSLEKEGKWKKVSRVIVSSYFINIPGVVFLYRVI